MRITCPMICRSAHYVRAWSAGAVATEVPTCGPRWLWRSGVREKVAARTPSPDERPFGDGARHALLCASLVNCSFQAEIGSHLTNSRSIWGKHSASKARESSRLRSHDEIMLSVMAVTVARRSARYLSSRKGVIA